MARSKRLAIVLAWFGAAGLLAHCGGANEQPADDIPLPDRVPAAEAGGEEAAADARRACDSKLPFAAPMLVPGLDPGVFFATPRLSPDELSIFFTTLSVIDGSLQADLVRAVRPARDAPFGPATLLGALNTPASDNDPTVGSDFLALWFSSARSGNNQLYVARRTSTSEEWGAHALVPGLAGPSQDTHPYYRAAGPELWFTSDRGDAGTDIYVAPLRDGSFGPVTLVPELNTPAVEAHPQVTEDGLGVLLASNREGGAGGFDLWVASRRSTTEKFGAPTSLAEVNTADDEYGGWISPDGCRVYFSSNRDTDAQPHHRLWYAERPK
jgi:Tol biopolymer transport system component